MKNRILHLTRTIIPYVKELMPLAQSVTGCLLMQQLDYWFERQPDGFFKFMEPAPDHPNYRAGDSWCEELGVSRAQFRTAFEAIGTIYRSKSEFDKAADKFQGRFYCSFYDRRRQLTFYYRNHDMVDKALDALISVSTGNFGSFSGGNTPEITVTGIPTVPVIQQPSITGTAQHATTGNATSASPVSRETALTVSAEPSSVGGKGSAVHETSNPVLQEVHSSPLLVSETTVQRSPQLQHSPVELEGQGGSSSPELVFPKNISPVETEALAKILAEYPSDVQQQVLDEIEGARQKDKLRAGAVPFGRFLASAFDVGQFVPNLGLAVFGARQKRLEAERREAASTTVAPGFNRADVDRSIASLPASLQQSLQFIRTRVADPKPQNPS